MRVDLAQLHEREERVVERHRVDRIYVNLFNIQQTLVHLYT